MGAYVLVVMFLLHILRAEGQPLVEAPVRVPAKVLSVSAGSTCPSDQDAMNAKDQLRLSIPTTLAALTTGCGGAGWRRVGFLDMTDPSESCPFGLILTTYSSSVRACGRAGVTSGCWSTFYNTGGSQYSRVCGRVRGYQYGAPIGYLRGHEIDSFYVEGVSLTHGQGSSRTHIWTFAAGVAEIYEGNRADQYCPCVTAGAEPPPLYVGGDYFCESGFNGTFPQPGLLFSDDPLWDGQKCVGNCCFNNPPYFTKTLPVPTSDDIELRICNSHTGQDAGTPVDQVELYVQ